MIKMGKIEIVRGDRNFYLEFTILDSDGNVLDLTNATPRLKWKNYEDGTVYEIVGDLVEPKEGTCRFFVEDQFVGVTGEFKAEIEITYSDGRVITAPNLSIKVIPDLA